MKNIIKISAAVIALSAAQFIPVHAETRTTEVTRTDASGTTTTTTTKEISTADRDTIRTYVKKNKAKLPKGFVRTTTYDERFPSTWREKVIVGETFPETYYSYGTIVTADELGLPAQPEKTTLFALDGSIIRVDSTSHKVLDVYSLD
ncbi:MAG: hypothetical protein ACAI35_22880 [Candidatus Methylacidiphilales bacterium]